MTPDDLLDGLAVHDPVPLAAMAAALERWDEVVPRFRALLRGYVDGADLSERTERALYPITHLLGERADTASFPDLCRLAASGERLHSVLGSDAACLFCPSILVGTFDGDATPLFRLAEAAAEEAVRCDAVLAVAFLAGQGRIADKQAYPFLASLPARLDRGRASDVWWGFARAVATLGFPGLSAAVEAAIDGGCIPAPAYPKAEFWRHLRDTQLNGRDYSGGDWQRFEPLGSAADHLAFLAQTDGAEGDGFDGNGAFDAAAAAEPVRNPLRSVGRNDPCPCGSGKKFKKCCRQTGAD